MLFFPNAKINIGLNIVSKRPDGYHNIETVFYPVGLADAVEFVPETATIVGGIPEISFSGLDFDKNPKTDLCIRAYQLLRKDFKLPPLKIHLHKMIPVGAGLGGGSSDAAFMIRHLNEALGLGLSNANMEKYAASIGSDCAFFIKNKPVFATGRGNEFTPIDFSLTGHYLVLVCPNIHVSTAEAYSMVVSKEPEASLHNLIQLPVEQWRSFIVNDFEKSVFSGHPEIEKIKMQLYAEGALYASMSGSGSSVYGIFKEKKDLKGLFKDCFVWDDEL
jgi:4-diphosphocytidyl-2-C-methyl-D-erythritol kinase